MPATTAPRSLNDGAAPRGPLGAHGRLPAVLLLLLLALLLLP